ncbi:MAG: HAMP domain-containing histidine kinase [Treponema sp.]|nr:HAMP domain-containing histidine kinase [Treponema sp.]
MAFFSFLLFAAFLIIGIIFNIAARQYIQANAIAQLDRSYNAIQDAIDIAEVILLDLPRERVNDRAFSFAMRRNEFRIESNIFILNSDLAPVANQYISETSQEILNTIQHERLSLEGMQNRMIRTEDGSYYVSSYHLPNPGIEETVYGIIYADITGLSNFAQTVNRFLILLVCVMFVIAVISSFFLSEAITGPIKKLSAFAASIGQGNFSAQDYGFKDKEFDDLNKALNRSAKQLEIYDGEQKTFFQNVSHELRTPLMTIQCYAEGIQVGLMDPKEASDTILTESMRLNEMVKDLLYISKLDNITPAFPVSCIDLIPVVKECARKQEALAEKSQLQFTYCFDREPVLCDCVEELITRALENLISNALRYASTQINISCQRAGSLAIICVQDDGPGISETQLPHIFERFYKGQGGKYGIGLSIVKAIIDQHLGTVKAENNSTGGAIFTIMIPSCS